MARIANWRAYPTILEPGGAKLDEAATVARARMRAARHAEGIPMFDVRRDHSRALVIRQARGGLSRGQGFVEYVLIILFVALAVVLALSLLAPEISAIFDTISSAL